MSTVLRGACNANDKIIQIVKYLQLHRCESLNIKQRLKKAQEKKAVCFNVQLT